MPEVSEIFPRNENGPGRPRWLAGAPGFEPGDGGIKIRCLTTWLRPNRAWRMRADHSGAPPPGQSPIPTGRRTQNRLLFGPMPYDAGDAPRGSAWEDCP